MKKLYLLLILMFLALSGQTCALFGSSGSGVLRSIDGGKSWQTIDEIKIQGEKTENPPNAVYSLAVSQSNTDVIYVGTLGLGVYKTDNKGRTWKRINNGIDLSVSQPIIYDIVVDAKDENIVYAAGITKEYGKIYKSTNGGENWREVFSEAQKKLPVKSLAISTKNPKIIIAGSATGGVYASDDRGESWQHAGRFENSVVSVGINNSNVRVIYVATKTKGAFRSDNFGKTWKGLTKKVGPDKESDSNNNSVPIGKIAVAPSNGRVVYIGTRFGIYQSRNGGNSWTRVSTTLPDKEAPLTTDIKVDPRNSNIIYFTIPNVVYKADGSGGRWVSAQLSIDAKVSRLAIDPKNPKVMYAGVGK